MILLEKKKNFLNHFLAFNLHVILLLPSGLDINACPGQVNVLDRQVKEKLTCLIGQVTWKCQYQKTITSFICDIAFVIGKCDMYRLR